MKDRVKKIHQAFHGEETWKRNLIVLWFGAFMTGIGFSSIMPFLSLFISSDLGHNHFTAAFVTTWNGYAFSATFVTMAIVSPIWGLLADKKGRKLMLLRASLGMSIVFFLMSTITAVWQLVALRAILGIFGGYISNSMALMASSAPRRHSGFVLGTMGTGATAGSLVGPLIGGAIAGAFGHRLSFFITGIILLFVFVLTWKFVKEDFKPVPKGKMKSFQEIFQELKYPRLIIGMFITSMIIQLSAQSITPFLSPYVEQLNGKGNIDIVSGIIASLPGIATFIAAPRFGRLGDRIGIHKILIFGLILGIAVYIPMGLVQNAYQLGALRFIAGISDACLVPAVQTILAKNTPKESSGRIFSYNQTFQSVGNIFGPLLGSTIASSFGGLFGYQLVFFTTAILVAINLFLVLLNTKVLRRAD